MNKACNTCRFHEIYNDDIDEYCCCNNEEAIKNETHLNNCLSMNLEEDCTGCDYYEDYQTASIHIVGEKDERNIKI